MLIGKGFLNEGIDHESQYFMASRVEQEMF